MSSEAAPIALTMGEPAGVGPELAAAAWRLRGDESVPAFAYLGDAETLHRADPGLPVKKINDIREADETFASALPVLHAPLSSPATPGTPSPATARDVLASIEAGIALCEADRASALVTNPIQKSVLRDAGFPVAGHTDYLSEQAGLGPDGTIMMMACPGLRVALVTHHIPLEEVPLALTRKKIIYTAKVTLSALGRHFGIRRPKLAVTGLNPHAGENGRLGTEERTVIAPAIEALNKAGHRVDGPFAADSLFAAANRKRYDAILVMYHDQGLIPVKALNFRRGVNITLGLDYIRTSPDHGTALDKVGSGKADPTSLIEALKTAHRMSRGVQR